MAVTKKSTRVGIVTLYGLWNYGNRLQNYAVSRILKEKGFRTETFVLRRWPLTRMAKELGAQLVAKTFFAPLKLKKMSAFISFDRRLKKRYVRHQRHANRLSLKFPFVIVGSDQIWNPSYGITQPGYKTLSEIGHTRIALAPSLGVTRLSKEQEVNLASHLRSVKHLSTREYRGSELVSRLTDRLVETLVDPTLILDAEEWEAIANFTQIPSRPYALVYLLGDRDSQLMQNIRSYTEKKSLTLAVLLDLSEPTFYATGPAEFLGLMRHAALVITDSYHAVIFGIQFNREVLLIRRRGGEDMNSRFDTLQEMLQLSYLPDSRIPGSELVRYDHQLMDSLLQKKREEFSRFLEASLEV